MVITASLHLIVPGASWPTIPPSSYGLMPDFCVHSRALCTDKFASKVPADAAGASLVSIASQIFPADHFPAPKTKADQTFRGFELRLVVQASTTSESSHLPVGFNLSHLHEETLWARQTKTCNR